MSEYTKQREIRQYSEWVYYKDGEEIERVTVYDDHAYDADPMEPMTEDEIEEYGDE